MNDSAGDSPFAVPYAKLTEQGKTDLLFIVAAQLQDTRRTEEGRAIFSRLTQEIANNPEFRKPYLFYNDTVKVKALYFTPDKWD